MEEVRIITERFESSQTQGRGQRRMASVIKVNHPVCSVGSTLRMSNYRRVFLQENCTGLDGGQYVPAFVGITGVISCTSVLND